MAAQDQIVPNTAQPNIPLNPQPEIKVTIQRGDAEHEAQSEARAEMQPPVRTEPIPPELPGLAETAPAATAPANEPKTPAQTGSPNDGAVTQVPPWASVLLLGTGRIRRQGPCSQGRCFRRRLDLDLQRAARPMTRLTTSSPTR